MACPVNRVLGLCDIVGNGLSACEQGVPPAHQRGVRHPRRKRIIRICDRRNPRRRSGNTIFARAGDGIVGTRRFALPVVFPMRAATLDLGRVATVARLAAAKGGFEVTMRVAVRHQARCRCQR